MYLDSILKELYIWFVWRILYEFDDYGGEINDKLIFNSMNILSVSRNPRNPSVKGLHSHALEWLVFMYLASIWKELYMLYKTFHPCNLGSGVTNLLLDLQTIILYRNWNENRNISWLTWFMMVDPSWVFSHSNPLQSF